jgi:hypothetical protein
MQFAARLMTTLPLAKAPDAIWNGLWTQSGRNPQTRGVALRFAVAGGVAAALLVAVGVFLRRDSPATPPAPVAREAAAPPTAQSSAGAAERPEAPDAGAQPVRRSSAETPSWLISSVRGTPRIGSSIVSSSGRLRVGEAIHTDTLSEARLKIAEVGELHVQPNSIVRLLVTRPGEHRIALERGRLEARSWARPRVFVVDTPTAAAVDLGCRYTLEVGDDGGSLLHVVSGVVALQVGKVETVVPAGAFCRTRPKTGPGSPFFETASEAFRSALDRVDADVDQGDRSAQLDVVLAESRARDALTLWHLLPRVETTLRGRIYDRLAEFAPPPPGVTRDGVVALDPGVLDRWKGRVSRLWQPPAKQTPKTIQAP